VVESYSSQEKTGQDCIVIRATRENQRKKHKGRGDSKKAQCKGR